MGFKDDKPGNEWQYRFLKRFIQLESAAAIDLERDNAHAMSVHSVTVHFARTVELHKRTASLA